MSAKIEPLPFNDCSRCGGSGIDPVDSAPMSIQDGSMMEPAVLEPCRDCVIPNGEADIARRMTACPYYNGTGGCITGCWDGPHCITDEPEGGWDEHVRGQ